MICKNCQNTITDDSKVCAFCGVYQTAGVFSDSVPVTLVYDNVDNITFSINASQTIYAGRKDMGVDVDIDLGPYDEKRIISRKHGIFTIRDHTLYYTHLGKNNAFLNKTNLRKSVSYPVTTGSILDFSGLKLTVLYE